MENLISSAERRAIINNEKVIVPRICDLQQVLPGMTGKLELVFEGEQEGSVKVSRALIGKAVREIFKKYFPDPLQKKNRVNRYRLRSRRNLQHLAKVRRSSRYSKGRRIHADNFVVRIGKQS